jgi:hypothetical protein
MQILKVKAGVKNKVGFKLKETHQLVVYADDVNRLENNINFIKKHREAPIRR